MSISIVDPFEVIEVCDEDRDGAKASFCPRQFLVQGVQNRRMIQQSGQWIVSSLFLGVAEKLEILNRRSGLRGEGLQNLFIQFAEVDCEALGRQFVRQAEPAKEFAMASNRDPEKRGHRGMVFGMSQGDPMWL